MGGGYRDIILTDGVFAIVIDGNFRARRRSDA
jgi:hypothetical protein